MCLIISAWLVLTKSCIPLNCGDLPLIPVERPLRGVQALCNVVQALANIQGEIVNLAQCLRPTPRTQPQTQTVKTSQTAAIATPATSPTAVMPNAGINQHQPSIHHHYHQSQPPVANAVSPGNRSNAVGGQTPAGSSSSSSAKKRGSGPDEDESKV